MDKLCLLFVILFTNMVQTISGFAGTMLAMPVSILLVGITDAKIILNTVGLFCCIVMAFQNYRSIEYREFFRIIAAMSLGMLLAQGISGRIRLEFLLVVYGLLIIIHCGTRTHGLPARSIFPVRRSLSCWLLQEFCMVSFSRAGPCWSSTPDRGFPTSRYSAQH